MPRVNILPGEHAAGTDTLYRTRLVGRDWIAHDTLSVRVERPSGFTFRAGQYLDVTVLNTSDRDALGPTRSLSIASAPGAGELEFLMRFRDTAFKRSLATLPLGTSLSIEGPQDDLCLHPEPGRELVFVAGGVGVAPFLSALREAVATETTLPATLFYSNRRPEDTVCLEELRQLEHAIRGFRLVATMTRMADSARNWTGETERLGAGLLERYLGSLVGPTYYLAGSPLFVSRTRRALTGAGVPNPDINLEMYVGY